jgi:hypothetical protein
MLNLFLKYLECRGYRLRPFVRSVSEFTVLNTLTGYDLGTVYVSKGFGVTNTINKFYLKIHIGPPLPGTHADTYSVFCVRRVGCSWVRCCVW